MYIYCFKKRYNFPDRIYAFDEVILRTAKDCYGGTKDYLGGTKDLKIPPR
jgi:hypothetical protein